MSSKNNECRFCLKKLDQNERMALIDSEIHDQFTSITQMNLEVSSALSQIICELCLRSLQLASAVKIQLIENQRKLQKYSEEENDSDQRSESSIVVPQPSQPKRRKKDRQMRAADEYIDPLQLVSVHDNNDNCENSNENRQNFRIKRERSEEYEPFNYEDQPSVLDNLANSSHSEERKPKFRQLYNVPKVERKKNVGEQRNFQCPHCKNFYKRKPHMLRHIEVNHMKVKFICVVPDCDQFFVRKERLKKHIEINHSNLTPMEMALMIEKIRALKPVYGNENPDTADDSQNASGLQGDDSINQDESDGNTGNFGESHAGSSRVFEPANSSNFDTDESLFRGIQLESIKRFALEKALGMQSCLSERAFDDIQ